MILCIELSDWSLILLFLQLSAVELKREDDGRLQLQPAVGDMFWQLRPLPPRSNPSAEKEKESWQIFSWKSQILAVKFWNDCKHHFAKPILTVDVQGICAWKDVMQSTEKKIEFAFDFGETLKRLLRCKIWCHQQKMIFHVLCKIVLSFKNCAATLANWC